MSIDSFTETLKKAQAEQKLQSSSYDNITKWLTGDFLPQWAIDSIEQLVRQGGWEELNDRFFENLAFGTGGLRGRTMGSVITSAEKGSASGDQAPEYPGVGSNMINDFNVIRATLALFRYCSKKEETKSPTLVIAHDVRYFSRHFCLLTASTWTKCGGVAYIYDGPRSTPQLSFSVRYLKATAGIVITASHNPPHDNGYKVYYKDGAQIVSPHAEAIIEEYKKIDSKELKEFYQIDETKIASLDPSIDEAYQNTVAESVINPDLLKGSPKVVYTPLHGTGRVAAIPLLTRFGVDLTVVEEQAMFDPAFSTVKSPNPENPEALSLAIKVAEKIKADLVMGTDPDGDRMGGAASNKEGKMEVITGNMIGSALAEYRISKMRSLGMLPEDKSAALVTTYVTTPLLGYIAKAYNVKIIKTLTGFKWIGEKLNHYELELESKLRELKQKEIDYDGLDYNERRELLLNYSTYFVFGAEESFGYLSSNRVRDKDANEAVLLLSELVADLKSQGSSFLEYLDSIYIKYGYFKETLLNFYYEGSEGMSKIKAILKSYRENPPKQIGEHRVHHITDFGTEDIHDADGKKIPAQDFYIVELENGLSYAVRASGTEPKIKFYLFGHKSVKNAPDLPAVKDEVGNLINKLGPAIKEDAHKRAHT